MKKPGMLIVTVGLPGSGKSTWAKRKRRRRPLSTRVVERDKIRKSLRKKTGSSNESEVTRISDTKIREGLSRGKRVIVSDTNLDPAVRKRLSSIAKETDSMHGIKSFTHVPLDTVLKQNKSRRKKKRVPDAAIYSMYNEYIR